MAGIFLLMLICLWGMASLTLSFVATKRVSGRWRVPIFALMTLALLPLPVADELIGRWQFEKLCQQNHEVKISSSARGRKVFLEDSPIVEINDKALRMRLVPWRYLDTYTKEEVVSYNAAHSRGGMLSGISQGAPLLFRGSCTPPAADNKEALFKELGITQVQRSEIGK